MVLNQMHGGDVNAARISKNREEGVSSTVDGICARPSGIARSALRPRASRHDVMLCCTKFLERN